MANKTAQAIIDEAEIILQDADNDRWDDEANLLLWLNEGQKVIVTVKPDANPVIESMILVTGALQSLPAKAIQLLDVTNNMGTNGTTVGDPVTVIDRVILDAAYPGWRQEAAAAVVKHVMYDPKRLPKKFFVYPQSTGTNYIEIITAKLPDDVADIANPINLSDEYASALMDWILFRAFSVDADFTESAERALVHLDAFKVALGIRELNEEKYKPNRSSKGNE